MIAEQTIRAQTPQIIASQKNQSYCAIIFHNCLKLPLHTFTSSRNEATQVPRFSRQRAVFNSLRYWRLFLDHHSTWQSNIAVLGLFAVIPRDRVRHDYTDSKGSFASRRDNAVHTGSGGRRFPWILNINPAKLLARCNSLSLSLSLARRRPSSLSRSVFCALDAGFAFNVSPPTFLPLSNEE